MTTVAPHCDPCKTNDDEREAVSWCSVCQECLCEDCDNTHRKLGITKNHKPLPIEEYLKLPASILTHEIFCSKHMKNKAEFFCTTHGTTHCHICYRDVHNHCKQVLRMDDASRGLKASPVISSATDKIKEVTDCIDKLIENRVKNIIDLDEKRDKLENDIKKLRLDMENHLDTIENNLLSQLNEAYSYHRDAIKTQEIEFSETKEKLSNMLHETEQKKEISPETQMFLQLQSVHEMLLQTDRYLQGLKDKVKFIKLDLIIEKNARSFGEFIKQIGQIKVIASTMDIFNLDRKPVRAYTLVSRSSIEKQKSGGVSPRAGKLKVMSTPERSRTVYPPPPPPPAPKKLSAEQQYQNDIIMSETSSFALVEDLLCSDEDELNDV
ncbi:Hypothetical predicted protein [Mytilus galloprovincialis]|uniref:B box-type domain-containing protein n=1 Tax=Mytilus galloprovincialis TaxID=29158 RepID=A0A8B6DQ96_MYTGA|nr:Hypothetical predicted protein [Mytilus galloprovincialis]